MLFSCQGFNIEEEVLFYQARLVTPISLMRRNSYSAWKWEILVKLCLLGFIGRELLGLLG